MKVKEIGEFGLIEKIKEIIPKYKPPVKTGVGDDCAIIAFRDREILITTDALIEDTHFKIPPFSWYDIGRKAASSNISDIASMGGIPEVLTVSLGIKGNTEVDEIMEFYRGLIKVSSKYRCQVVGGDICKANKCYIAVTVVGSNEKGGSILRSTAKPGDIVCVTGKPGMSAIGLEALLHGYPLNLFLPFVEKHLEPEIRVAFARTLSISKLATAMIDISDGLISDAERIADSSGVKVVIEKDKLPVPQLEEHQRSFLKNPPEYYTLFGGEEYELLFTIAPQNLHKLEKLSAETQTEVYIVGYIEEGRGTYIKIGSCEEKIEHRGFRHF